MSVTVLARKGDRLADRLATLRHRQTTYVIFQDNR
jgi:hypothetical protein